MRLICDIKLFISATYQFLGKTNEEAQREFKAIDKGGYKAILFLFPKGSDLSVRIRARNVNGAGQNHGIVERDRESYQQLYDFQLCKTDTNTTLIWNAIVNINCDPTKKYAAKKLATQLFDKFKQAGYLR